MKEMEYPKNRPFIVELQENNYQIVSWSESKKQFLFAGFPISESCFKNYYELPE